MLWSDRSSQLSAAWLESVWPFLWQSTLLVLCVTLALTLFKSLSPVWRHRLWLLVAAKLLVLPSWFWTVPWQTPPSLPAPTPTTQNKGTRLPAITDPLLSTSPTLETPRLTPQVNTSLSRPEVKPLPDVERERSTPEITTIEVAASSPTITVDKPASLPLDDDQLASPPPVGTPEIAPNTPPQTKILSTIPSAPPKQTATWSDRWNTLSAGTLRHSPQLLFMLWLAGVTWGVARWLFYWTRLRCLLAAATPADPELQAESQRVAAEYKLHPVPRLVVTQASCSPFVCGGLRPTVVLPASLLPHLEPGELRRILLHEQAHLKRRDLWWNWLPELCVVLYWFHPLVYWVRRQTYSETELACDRLAIKTGDLPPGDYADTLVRIITHLSESQRDLPALIAATTLGASS